MFTGIVSGLGRILRVNPLGSGQDPRWGLHLTLQAPPGYLADVQPGDSIALNGACMTVTTLDPAASHFGIDISAESLARTCGLDRPGEVNLEKALRASDRLGGHLVSGHVDGLGRVVTLEAVGESWHLAVRAPRELARFLATKGSLTVQGVSLTLNQIDDEADGTVVHINLVPQTMSHTTLGRLQAGDAVNLEIDLIARYLDRLAHAPR
jgi:riboflavin synthase